MENGEEEEEEEESNKKSKVEPRVMVAGVVRGNKEEQTVAEFVRKHSPNIEIVI